MKKGDLQEIISHIHGCLNISKQRLEGFIFLDKLVEQCITEEFTQHASTWIRFIIQCLESYDPAKAKILACCVGCRILPLTVNFTALNKDVTGMMPQLLSALQTYNDEWMSAALKLLTVVIRSYPGPCGPSKGKLEKLTLELLKEETVPKEAVTLYVALAGCGGGGTKGIKHTDAWTYKCQQILTSLNNVSDLMYEGLNIQESNYSSDIPALPRRDLPGPLSEQFNDLSSYYNTYTMCLQELLSQPFSAPVRVPVDDILQFVYKVLSVDNKVLHSRPSTERLLLSGYTSRLHCGALMCLQNLIARCTTLLLPHSKSVVSLLVQELIWSNLPVVYGRNRAYSCLRQTVYQTVIMWLQTTQSFTETSTEVEWFVQEIIHDARPHTDTMKIDPSKAKGTNAFEPPPMKKKKKGGYSELSHGISSQRKIDLEANSELCLLALEGLYWLINSVGCYLTQKTIQEIQEFITSVAVTFRHKGSPDIPYTNERCRYCLLRVMQALNLMPHPTSPSILQISLLVLRCTAQDTSSLVSSFSIESLHICEALVHARAPCFQKTRIIEREVIQEKMKTSSENNIAVSKRNNSSIDNKMKSPSLFDSARNETPSSRNLTLFNNKKVFPVGNAEGENLLKTDSDSNVPLLLRDTGREHLSVDDSDEVGSNNSTSVEENTCKTSNKSFNKDVSEVGKEDCIDVEKQPETLQVSKEGQDICDSLLHGEQTENVQGQTASNEPQNKEEDMSIDNDNEVMIQNEDQKEIDDMLSSFVDIDTDP